MFIANLATFKALFHHWRFWFGNDWLRSGWQQVNNGDIADLLIVGGPDAQTNGEFLADLDMLKRFLVGTQVFADNLKTVFQLGFRHVLVKTRFGQLIESRQGAVFLAQDQAFPSFGETAHQRMTVKR